MVLVGPIYLDECFHFTGIENRYTSMSYRGGGSDGWFCYIGGHYVKNESDYPGSYIKQNILFNRTVRPGEREGLISCCREVRCQTLTSFYRITSGSMTSFYRESNLEIQFRLPGVGWWSGGIGWIKLIYFVVVNLYHFMRDCIWRPEFSLTRLDSKDLCFVLFRIDLEDRGQTR